MATEYPITASSREAFETFESGSIPLCSMREIDTYGDPDIDAYLVKSEFLPELVDGYEGAEREYFTIDMRFRSGGMRKGSSPRAGEYPKLFHRIIILLDLDTADVKTFQATSEEAFEGALSVNNYTESIKSKNMLWVALSQVKITTRILLATEQIDSAYSNIYREIPAMIDYMYVALGIK